MSKPGEKGYDKQQDNLRYQKSASRNMKRLRAEFNRSIQANRVL